MAGILAELLDRAKSQAEMGRAQAGSLISQVGWDAALMAIESTLKRADVLEGLGLDRLREALKGWSSDMSHEERIRRIKDASTVADLIADALQDAAELRADTARRAKEYEELMAWLLELGMGGAQVLLRIALV